jgi:tetratricopeptide (TPR) repeat protein
MRNSLLLLWLFISTGAMGYAQEEPKAGTLSRQAPALYKEKLADRLTTLDAAKTKFPKDLGAEDGGVVLINEQLHYLHDDASRLSVEHRIIQPVNQAGVESAARFVTGCRRTGQKMHLVEARTITPDGKFLPVQADAAFIQTPQRDADEALYSDYQELVVIFPDVKPGCQTEVIVVVETELPRIPGHFTDQEIFSYYWPTQRIRLQIDLPAPMAKKLQTSSVGTGVPEVARVEADGRVLLTWDRKNIPGIREEHERQPVSQSGPCISLSTLQNWEEFLAWYAPQVVEKKTLSDALKTVVEETTAGSVDLRQTLDRLQHKVSTEVRYVGLEFGYCDLIPHLPADVWANQYGDCKDKANLLRAMLAAKGIKSHLALVNTEHIGRIEKRNPDYRDFTHVILAVEEKPDQFIFCDPTVPGLPAGRLGPSTSNREVLLVDATGPVRWITTPAQPAGTLHYEYDATIDSSGGWAGWLKFGASDYFGAVYSRREKANSRDQQLRSMANLLSGLSEAVRTIDLKPGKPVNEGDYATEVYFVIPGAGSTVRFPCSVSVLPNLGDGKQRATPFPLWNEEIQVSAKLKLPPGWQPESLPKPYHAESTYGDGDASWSFAEGVLSAKFNWKIKRTPLPPAEADAFASTVNSFKSWLEKPINLIAGDAPANPSPKAPDPLPDFERMPTGDGQLALVNEKYPSNGNLTLRRMALRKTRQYFPEDKDVVFRVGFQLANMDLDADKSEEALDALETLLATMKDTVDAEVYASAEHIKGVALQKLDRSEEALSLWQRLAADTTLSESRRGFALYRMGKTKAKSEPKTATEFLRQGLKLNSGAEHFIYQELSQLMVRADEGAALTTELKQLIEQAPEHLTATLETLAETVISLPEADAEVSAKLLSILRSLGDSADVSQFYTETLNKAEGQRQGLAASKLVQEKLRKFVKTNATAIPAVEIPKALNTAAKLDAAAEELNTKVSSPDRATRYSLERILSFEPGEDYSQAVWSTTAFAEWWWRTAKHEAEAKNGTENETGKNNPASPLLSVLLDLCELFPAHTDAPFDGALLRADWLIRQGKPKDALPLLSKILDNDALRDSHKVTSLYKRAQLYESLDRVGDARKDYRTLEPFVTKFYKAMTGIYRGILIDLELGKYQEALRGCELLSQIKPDVLAKSEGIGGVTDLLAMSKNPDAAISYWKQSNEWLPRWKIIQLAITGVSKDKHKHVLPVIDSPLALGQRLGEAIRAENWDATDEILTVWAGTARWTPEMLVELQGLLASFSGITTRAPVPKCRALCEELLQFVPEAEVTLRRRSLVLAAAVALDGRDPKKAIGYATDFAKIPLTLDAINLAMGRIFAIAAVRAKQDESSALKTLEQAINAKVDDDATQLTIPALCALYERLGPAVVNLETLAYLASLPGVKADASLMKMITEQQQIGGKMISPAGLSEAARTWLKEAKPVWWELCEPRSIDKQSEGELSDLLLPPKQDKDVPAQFKAAMLILHQGTQDARLQLKAFDVINDNTTLMLQAEGATNAFITHFVESPGLSQATQAELYRSIVLPTLLKQPAAWTQWKRLSSAKAFGKQFPQLILLATELLDGDASDPARLQHFAAACVKEPVSRFLGLLSLDKLIAIGHLNIVKSTLRQLDRKTQDALKSWSERQIKAAELLAKERSVLQPLCLEIFADVPLDPSVKAIKTPWRFLPHDKLATHYLALARQTPAPLTPLFWNRFFDTNRSRLTAEQKHKVASAYLDGLDEEAMSALDFLSRLYDIDDPAQRDIVRQQLTSRATHLSLYNAAVEMRTNPKADLRKLIDANTKSDSDLIGLTFEVGRTFLARSDSEGVQWVVDREPSFAKLSPLHFHPLIAKALHDKPDLTSLEKKTRQELAGVIALQDDRKISSMLKCMEALGMANVMTPALEDAIRQFVPAGHPGRIELALLKERWEEALNLTTELLQREPTTYSFYWFQAEALSKLGKKEEAQKALATYLKYCINETEYPQALRLSQSLK